MSALLDQLLTREQRESCAKHDHPSLHDWSDEQRFSELVATHRSGFTAGTRIGCPECAWGKVAGCWRCQRRGADSAPQPAEACTELGADQIRESEADPWLWRLLPAAIAVGAILTAWFEVVA